MKNKLKNIIFSVAAIIFAGVMFVMPNISSKKSFAASPVSVLSKTESSDAQSNELKISKIGNFYLYPNNNGIDSIRKSFSYYYGSSTLSANESTETELIHKAGSGRVSSSAPGNGQFVSKITLENNLIIAMREGFLTGITATAYTHSRYNNAWEAMDEEDTITMDVYAYDEATGQTDYAFATYGDESTQYADYSDIYSATINQSQISGKAYNTLELSFKSTLTKAMTYINLGLTKIPVESTTGQNNMVVKEPTINISTSDSVSPTVSIVPNTTGWAQSKVLTVSVSENESGIQTIECSTDGINWTLLQNFATNMEYKKSHSYDVNLNENGSYHVKVTDNVGNETVVCHNEEKIEKEAPEVEIENEFLFNTKQIKFTLNTLKLKAPETYTYTLIYNKNILGVEANQTIAENVEFNAGETTIDLSNEQNGYFSLVINASDSAGNTMQSVTVSDILVDAREVVALDINHDYVYSPNGFDLVYTKSVDADVKINFSYSNLNQTEFFESVSNAGTYLVHYSINELNYKASSFSEFVISPAPVTVSNLKTDYFYNAKSQEISFDISNTNIPISVSYSKDGFNTTTDFVNAGVYSYLITTSNTNYSISNSSGTVEMKKFEIQISNVFSSFVYDKTEKQITFDVNPSSQKINIKVDYYKQNSNQEFVLAQKTIDAETYYAVLSFVGDTNNYSFSSHTSIENAVSMQIEKRAVSVEVVSQNIIYGNAVETLSYTSKNTLTEEPLLFTLVCDSLKNDVGNYPISIVQKTVQTEAEVELFKNYNITFVEGSITISPKDIFVVPNESQTKIYGNADETLTYQTYGLIEGTSLAGNLSREQGEDVGYYNITIGTLSNSNYKINLESAVFEILKRKAFVVVLPAEKTYGESDPTFNFMEIGSNILESDLPLFSANELFIREQGEDVGFYNISFDAKGSSSNVLKNYNILSASANLTIKKATLDVQADAKNVTFGESENLSAVVSGFKFDDENSIEIELEREQGNDVGTYQINLKTNTLQNYNINYVSAVYQINPKQIQIKANSSSKVYGEPDNLTCEVVGAYEDLEVVLTRKVGENVGTYQIDGYQFEHKNYVVSKFEESLLTIEPASLNVVISNSSKVYGEEDTAFNCEIEGLVNGETLNLNLVREQGENAGFYKISMSDNQIQNYIIKNVTEGVFEIKKANISFVLSDKSEVYSGKPVYVDKPNFNYELSFVYLWMGSEIEAPVDAGEYQVKATFEGNQNFNPCSATAKITITQKLVPITLKKLTFVYNGKQQSPSYEIGNDEKIALLINYKNNMVPIEVGEYEFEIISNNPNYRASTKGTLKIVEEFYSSESNGSNVSSNVNFGGAGIKLMLNSNSKLMKAFNPLFDGKKAVAVYEFSGAENVNFDGEVYSVKLKAIDENEGVEIYTVDENGNFTKTAFKEVDGYYIFSVNNISSKFVITKSNEWHKYAEIVSAVTVLTFSFAISKIMSKKRLKKFIARNTFKVECSKEEISNNIGIVSSRISSDEKLSLSKITNKKWSWQSFIFLYKFKIYANHFVIGGFMNFNQSKTKQNLAKAFAAECQAGARYQFMATQAQNEKLIFVKDTMKQIAKNEMAHAKLFYDYILQNCGDDCKVDIKADYAYVQPSLEVSLTAEAEIEQEEFDTIYPEFAEVAREEGFKNIATSFEEVAKIEKTHAEMLKFISKNYAKNTLYKRAVRTLFKCTNCGHIDQLTEGWKKCPVCSLEQGNIAIDYSKILQDCLAK